MFSSSFSRSPLHYAVYRLFARLDNELFYRDTPERQESATNWIQITSHYPHPSPIPEAESRKSVSFLLAKINSFRLVA